MLVEMPYDLAARFRSPSQRARVISEGWGDRNLYCPRCDSPRLEASSANTQAVDFICPKCAACFQLKSQSRPLSRRIVDSAYAVMRRAIEQGQTPHLFALHYAPASWRVRDLMLIPSFALTLSCLERRKPLRSTARRRGWVGCNILLSGVPADARIMVIANGEPASPPLVRRQFARLQPLEGLGYETRGWALDVLGVVRSLQRRQFSLSDVYSHSGELRRLHPANLHVREKIRQQLQRLRDMGFVEFLGAGNYVLKGSPAPPPSSFLAPGHGPV